MATKSDALEKKYFQEEASKYYIHCHKNNVAKLVGDLSLTSDILKARNEVRQNVKDDYINYLKAQINPKSLSIFNAALEMNEEEVLNNLTKNMQEIFEKSFDTEKLSQLMQYDRQITSAMLKNILEGGKKGVEDFNKTLKIIAKSIKLLGGQDAGALAALLSSLKVNGSSTAIMGQTLQKELNAFKLKNNGRLITRKPLERVLNNLNGLAAMLTTGTNKQGNAISAQSLSRSISNNIYPTLENALSAAAQYSVNAKLNQQIKASMQGDSNTDPIKIEDENGEIISERSGIKSKVDVQFENVKINLTSDSNAEGASVSMTVGLSDKFYKDQHFPGLDKKSGDKYSLGTGGNLREALYNIFGVNYMTNLWARNILAHGDRRFSQSVFQLNDLILARQILRLAATSGDKDDFASFIFANGQLISIWDVVNYVLITDLNASNSQQCSSSSNSQALVLTLAGEEDKGTGRVAIQKNNRWIGELNKPNTKNAFARSRQVNAAIDATPVKAYIHINKLMEAAKAMDSNLTT